MAQILSAKSNVLVKSEVFTKLNLTWNMEHPVRIEPINIGLLI